MILLCRKAEFCTKAGLSRYIDFCQNTLFPECYPGVTELEPISQYFSSAKNSYPDPSADERDPFRYVEELGIKEASAPMQDTIYSLPIATCYLGKYPEPMKSIRKVLEQLSEDELHALRHVRVLIKRNRIPCFYNSIIEICASFVNIPCEKLHVSVAIVEECLKMMMDIHPDWDSPKSQSQTQSQVPSSSSSVSLIPETQSQRSSQLLPPKKKMKGGYLKRGKKSKGKSDDEEDRESEGEDDDDEKGDEIKPNFVGSEFPWLFYNSRLASKFCDLYCAYCLSKCQGRNNTFNNDNQLNPNNYE